MRKIAVAFLSLFLLCALPVFAGNQSDVRVTGVLTKTCSSTNSACATAGSTVQISSANYGIVLVTINGTYGTVTVYFDFSDDGGTTYYQTSCTQTDSTATAITHLSPSDNAYVAFTCPVVGSNLFRVRTTAIASGAVNVGLTATNSIFAR